MHIPLSQHGPFGDNSVLIPSTWATKSQAEVLIIGSGSRAASLNPRGDYSSAKAVGFDLTTHLHISPPPGRSSGGTDSSAPSIKDITDITSQLF